MAIAAVNPFVLKDVDLFIGLDPTGDGAVDPLTDTDYGGHTSEVRFTPSASQVTWNGLKPDATHSETGAEIWAATLALAQDWTTTGLARFLFTNAGQSAVIRFVPRAGGPSFDCRATLVSPEIGGAANAVATSTVTLGVNGRPTLVDA